MKNAAFLALIGTLLLTIVDAVVFLRDLSALSQNAIAVMTVFVSAIHLLASLTVTVFFFVFLRAKT